jgi:hypothetical protein
VERYAYDALGRLVTRTVGAGSASLSYLGGGDTLANDGTSNYSYTPSGDLTAEKASGGSAYATMSDQHDDVVASFSPGSTSGLGGCATGSPYGTATASGSSSDVGYQGDYTDPTTGLVDGRPLVQPVHRLVHQQRHHLRQPPLNHRRRQPLRLHQRQPPHRNRPHRALLEVAAAPVADPAALKALLDEGGVAGAVAVANQTRYLQEDSTGPCDGCAKPESGPGSDSGNHPDDDPVDPVP